VGVVVVVVVVVIELPNPSTCTPQNLINKTITADDMICINDTTDGNGKYSIWY